MSAMPPPPPHPDLAYAVPVGHREGVLPRVWPSYCDFVILLGTVLGAQVCICVMLAVYLVATGTPAGVLGDKVMELVAQPPVFAGVLGLTICIEACAAVVPAILSPTPFRARLSLTGSRISWVVLVLAAIGSTAYGVSFDAFAQLFSLRSASLEQLSDTLSSAEGFSAAVIAFLVCVAGPIVEELVFRGYIQTRLVARHGAFVGILLASLFFAILHMNPLHSTFAFGFGICMGIMAHRSGSIFPTIFAHIVNNSFATLANWTLPAPQTWETQLMVGLGAGGVSVVLLASQFLVKPRRRPAWPQSVPCEPPAMPDRAPPPP